MDKLVRFFALVKNEYIKINNKISTKIMLILLVLSIFAIPAVAMMKQHFMDNYEHEYEYDVINDYKSQISIIEETQPEDAENQLLQYNLLIDYELDYDDWRYDMIMESDLASMNSTELGQFKNIISANDWKTYLQKRLAEGNLTAGEKWAYSYRLENNISFDEQYEKQNNIIYNVMNEKDLIEMMSNSLTASKSKLSDAEEIVLLGTYQLEHNILENTAEQTSLYTGEISFWSVFLANKMIVLVVGFIIIVLAGGIVASEFSQGTIKFLLVNPVKRGKILMAKYFSCISYGYILIAAVFLLSIPITGLFMGFDGINTPYLYVENGTVHEMSSWIYAVKVYLLSSVNVVVMATLAFAISSLVRSSALAIGISVFFMCAGNTITLILNQLKQDWGRYLIFSNTDIMSIMEGSSLFPSHTLSLAITVIAAHMVVFLLTAWDGFTKKSI